MRACVGVGLCARLCGRVGVRVCGQVCMRVGAWVRVFYSYVHRGAVGFVLWLLLLLFVEPRVRGYCIGALRG